MTLTKEWLLKTIAELEEERDATPGAVNEDAAMALAAMKLALAMLEAEPVAYIFKHPAGRLFWSLTDESNKGQSDVMPVYTAQPAPVFVPDELTREEYKRRFMEDDDFDDTFRGGWKAHRAAMLQGSEPVTTAYKLRDAVEIIRNSGIEIDAEKIFAERDALNTPDCWCRTCRPVTVTDMRFVVCPDCGNKRCPHANDHRNACTGSNEPGQDGSAYPAAPQQEKS
ncbi:TPA: hypothetical protein I3322_000565 [Enterobacter hormaechei subsp. xiangfangensis]|nr:hypothetical protein [Enterobacter hormaechei subsp. xiangfangensis]HAS0855401.1 hypothetical protein [Enterobacter hormaechei subsp. xiangfangensis]HAT7689388.1 hypothetical protein [Enterobacter hormaechei subsp. xiangfangensis]